MDTIIKSFQDETGATVAVNYGPSGGLYSQITQGQPCDLYIIQQIGSTLKN
jgi:molybdate transport system substrate-binding protein